MIDWSRFMGQQGGRSKPAAIAEPLAIDSARSPFFATLPQRLQQRSRHVVLDLGAAQSGVVELFAPFNSRLVVADLAGERAALNAMRNSVPALQGYVGRVLPALDEPIDVVLCWDLLDGLAPEAIRALMAHIGACCRRGAVMHALMAYSSADMPATPCQWILREGDRLALQTQGDELRTSPRYSLFELQDCLPDYRLERAVLLRNGVQEVLLNRLDPP